jgi:RimJ/RimL family protein N-acetyltransferase
MNDPRGSMPQATPILRGGRARLRPLELPDADAIQRQFPKWEIVRYLGDYVPWPYPSDGALTHLTQSLLPAMAAGTEHHWAIERIQHPGTLLGVVSLFPLDESGNQRGFWLDPGAQGHGLGFEAAELVTAFAFQKLGMDLLKLANAEPNLGSVRIKERQGARYIRSEPGHFVSGSFPKQIWHLSKEDWLQRGIGSAT